MTLQTAVTVLVAGFGLSTVSWLIFAVTFAFDLSRYSLERTWLWRFPLVLIAAGQVAQLRYCFPFINLLYPKPNPDRGMERLHLNLLYQTVVRSVRCAVNTAQIPNSKAR